MLVLQLLKVYPDLVNVFASKLVLTPLKIVCVLIPGEDEPSLALKVMVTLF